MSETGLVSGEQGYQHLPGPGRTGCTTGPGESRK